MRGLDAKHDAAASYAGDAKLLIQHQKRVAMRLRQHTKAARPRSTSASVTGTALSEFLLPLNFTQTQRLAEFHPSLTVDLSSNTDPPAS